MTREMLDGVRAELVERIASLDSKISSVDSRLTSVDSKISSVDSRLTSVESRLTGEIHGLKADISRLGVLIEEQNSRNSIVFEALHAVVEKQARFDERLDRVEDTVRSIASGRRRS